MSPQPRSADAARIFGVGELTRWISDTLDALPPVWVTGELSGVKFWNNRMWFFSLLDPSGQALIDCVMWQRDAQRLTFDLEDGLEVNLFGELGVYAKRGAYRLQVSVAEPKGEGAAELAKRQLIEKLRKEGALDGDRKRAIPQWPFRIALVTAPHSAAVADLRRILQRRWPAADVVIAPTLVQGDRAPAQIAGAFDLVAQYGVQSGDFDVVICGRGGGSAEDLSAWNDERVARAILACPYPVVSAVGHEIDVSVADLVADVRAATPSEAAELAVPDREDVLAHVDDLRHQLLKAMRRKLADENATVAALAASWGLRHPLERLRTQLQRTGDLRERLGAALRARMGQTAVQLESLAPRLHTAAAANVHDARYRVGGLAGKLESLSPLKVLGRGYALVQRSDDGTVVTEPAQAPAGTALRLRTAGGALRARSDGPEAEE